MAEFSVSYEFTACGSRSCLFLIMLVSGSAWWLVFRGLFWHSQVQCCGSSVRHGPGYETRNRPQGRKRRIILPVLLPAGISLTGVPCRVKYPTDCHHALEAEVMYSLLGFLCSRRMWHWRRKLCMAYFCARDECVGREKYGQDCAVFV